METKVNPANLNVVKINRTGDKMDPSLTDQEVEKFAAAVEELVKKHVNRQGILFQRGIITQEEFDARKADLRDRVPSIIIKAMEDSNAV